MHSLGLGRVCVQAAEACAGISCGVWMYSKGDETKAEDFKKEGAKVLPFLRVTFLSCIFISPLILSSSALFQPQSERTPTSCLCS